MEVLGVEVLGLNQRGRAETLLGGLVVALLAVDIAGAQIRDGQARVGGDGPFKLREGLLVVALSFEGLSLKDGGGPGVGRGDGRGTPVVAGSGDGVTGGGGLVVQPIVQVLASGSQPRGHRRGRGRPPPGRGG